MVRVNTAPAPPGRTITVRAPSRIDLGGGWTDVPPYCGEQGGFVCNVAIARYATATVRHDETYRRGAPDGADERPADTPLVAAAVRRSGLTGVRVHVHSDFPVGAGLGGSSSASAAILGALRRWKGEPWDLTDIAEEGRRIEVEDLGISGGRQDHYAATHGGALALTFTHEVDVRRLRLSSATREALEYRSLLLYTRESRVSGATVAGVLDAYRAGEPRVLQALTTMKMLAFRMADALEAGDLDHVGALMAEHWVWQRTLHPAIPTARIDEIIMRAQRAGAAGWKAMGASGGGCVLVLAEASRVEEVRAAIAPLGEILPFTVDTDGLAEVAQGS
jgi:D-glycero-alpha-D-manno-heptose-7-phosphate kinase